MILSRLTYLLLLTVGIATQQVATAQDSGYKIGFVNTARVLKEAPQALEVEERLKAEFEPREAQLKEKRAEILALEETLKSDQQASVTTRRKLERELQVFVLSQRSRNGQSLRQTGFADEQPPRPSETTTFVKHVHSNRGNNQSQP